LDVDIGDLGIELVSIPNPWWYCIGPQFEFCLDDFALPFRILGISLIQFLVWLCKTDEIEFWSLPIRLLSTHMVPSRSGSHGATSNHRESAALEMRFAIAGGGRHGGARTHRIGVGSPKGMALSSTDGAWKVGVLVGGADAWRGGRFTRRRRRGRRSGLADGRTAGSPVDGGVEGDAGSPTDEAWEMWRARRQTEAWRGRCPC
jgi:hypothetical protein